MALQPSTAVSSCAWQVAHNCSNNQLQPACIDAKPALMMGSPHN